MACISRNSRGRACSCSLGLGSQVSEHAADEALAGILVEVESDLIGDEVPVRLLLQQQIQHRSNVRGLVQTDQALKYMELALGVIEYLTRKL